MSQIIDSIYKTLFDDIVSNTEYKIPRGKKRDRYEILTAKIRASGFRKIGSGIECAVFRRKKDDFVIKVYYEAEACMLPPEELLGSVFLPCLYVNHFYGVLFQPLVKPMSKDKFEDLYIEGFEKYRKHKNIFDCTSDNICIYKNQVLVLDYGCYKQ